MTTPDPAPFIRQLLKAQRFGTLATTMAGAPYTSLVAYVPGRDLRQIVLATSRATRKFSNLNQDNRVAFLVEDTRNNPGDLVDAAAVTALGRIRELAEPERGGELAGYLEKHPTLAEFVAAPSCALLVIDVEKYILVRHFQQVFEYRP